MNAKALILAAGAGTRMKSDKPKVAHEMLGKPLVRWVVDASHQAGIAQVVTVVGHKWEQVNPLVSADTTLVLQDRQLGTGHAVNVAREVFEQLDGSIAPGSLVVLSGDSPLVRPETLRAMIDLREQTQAAMVVLTMKLEDPFGYGRIIRGGDGQVLRIVEQKDATATEAAVKECNAGLYCFDTQALFEALSQVSNQNAQGEYYLTDVLEICRTQGRAVIAHVTDDPTEALGVNSRAQLAQATKVMQRRINRRHMDAGVTMWDPDQVWIGPDVRIDQDVELLPQTYLMGKTIIGSGTVIGPNSRLTDTTVGRDCIIDETVAQDARIDDQVTCGPRAYLRPGTHMCTGSKAGTHVEIKKSTIGEGSKVPHLSYIGDTTMGANVNIGAGSITCNYDGVSKHKTVIGDDVFVGSDTMLVAPVSIGDGAIVGAASCITKDVAPDSLALERTEQREFAHWASRHMEKLKAQRD